MTHQKRTRFMVAATLLGMILLGFAQGSGASELVGATEDGSVVAEVIEEIVVTGRKKDQRPNFSLAPSIESIVNTVGQFKFDFLPTYDLERSIRHVERLQLRHRPISRDGTIELFRISFGRRQP